MMRRFGSPIGFVTVSIDDVSNPHVFHLTFSQQDNENFPTIASETFLNCMEQGNTFAEGKVKIPLNWSTLAKAVISNPVASVFIYKRLLYYIIRILIGLKPAKLSDERSKFKVSPRFTVDSLNDEGGIMSSHATALSAVNECSQRGGLHGHALLHCALNPAVLQGSADIQELCDVVTDVLDSIFHAALPRQYHVKYLIEKELLFYPTSINNYEKLLRRGRAMLVSPDPTKKTNLTILFTLLYALLGYIHMTDRSLEDVTNHLKASFSAHCLNLVVW